MICESGVSNRFTNQVQSIVYFNIHANLSISMCFSVVFCACVLVIVKIITWLRIHGSFHPLLDFQRAIYLVQDKIIQISETMRTSVNIARKDSITNVQGTLFVVEAKDKSHPI